MPQHKLSPTWLRETLGGGIVIPAHPLALTSQRKLDEKRQRALTRYYHAAGAGGIAVGVHTTQFAIREPRFALLQPVLKLAADTFQACDQTTNRNTLLVAGICGRTAQACAEARLARDLGYHAGLLSLAAWKEAPDDALIEHCREVAKTMPIFGFYLQPAAGGRLLSRTFWRRFVEIPNVVAIKVAPFNRYQTLDVLHALAESGRSNDIAVYTGNDDSIVIDLITRFEIPTGDGRADIQIKGGLLGHWACWTRSAVQTLETCKSARLKDSIPASMLSLAAQVTDCNAAFFDAANQFAGCIPGIHEVLRRQGLLANNFCLDPREQLSQGQREEIDRVYAAYPELSDDGFVREHLAEWLRD